jgi:hypothetical protein
MTLVILLGVTVAIILSRHRLFDRIDRRRLRWLDAWLKAFVIAVTIAVLVVVIPARVLELESVADLDRPVQDLIGSGLWFVGLAVALTGLRLAQKHGRI